MDAYYEMLNSEKRVLEDRLYEAEYNYEQALKELETLRTSHAEPAATDASEKPTSPPPSGPEFRAPLRGESAAPSKANVEAPEIPDGPPKVELPPGFEDDARKPTPSSVIRKAALRTEAETLKPATPRKPLGDEELAAAVIAALDQHVDHIHINPRVTTGIDLDGHPGDDGILAVIEPRNKSGQFLAAPGAVTIALIDPAIQGDAGRVGRWDFDQAEAAQFLQQDGSEAGFHFQVPWQGVEPCNERLHLFIRYVTEDGTKIDADREISVRLASRVAQGWTPRPEREGTEVENAEVPVSWMQNPGDNAPTAVRAVGEVLLPAPPSAGASNSTSPLSTKPAKPTGRFWKPSR
jgi:hypothetical protein